MPKGRGSTGSGMSWLRLYNQHSQDLKFRALTDREYRFLVGGVWPLASENRPRGRIQVAGGIPPNPVDVAERAGLKKATLQECESIVESLEKVDLLRVTCNKTWCVPNWGKLQPKSDNVALRVRKHREKRKGLLRNGIITSNVLEQSRSDQRREENPVNKKAGYLDCVPDPESAPTSASALSQLIDGEEACITRGPPIRLVQKLQERGYDPVDAWGAIVQARAKKNPAGYLVKLLSEREWTVADSAREQARAEMRDAEFF